jgi:probable selenate reductase FAD-binding subunit
MIKNFLTPRTIEEAVRLYSDSDTAAYIAGGTELNSRNSRSGYDTLIDISSLGFNTISFDQTLKIGSMVTLETLKMHNFQDYPGFAVLKTAAENVSNRNIRNQATLGGNICACKSCSDMIPCLLVLNACVTMHTPDLPQKDIPLEEYLQLDKKELISSINIPAVPDSYVTALCRYTRTANDLALINICLGLDIQKGICKRAGLAIGGIAAKPKRIPPVEQALENQNLDSRLSELVIRIDPIITDSVSPVDDHRGSKEYKLLLTKGLFTDALYSAASKGGIKL